MKPSSIQLERIKATLGIQFPNIDLEQLLHDISITISRKTGRIRGIFDKEHNRLFSLRTSDGRYVPTFAGGTRMIDANYQGNRIVMNDDAAPFIAAGKSAFCKHVLSADDHIIPQSEVLLTNREGELLAVGTAQQPGYAILELQQGIAAKVKHGRDQ